MKTKKELNEGNEMNVSVKKESNNENVAVVKPMVNLFQNISYKNFLYLFSKGTKREKIYFKLMFTKNIMDKYSDIVFYFNKKYINSHKLMIGIYGEFMSKYKDEVEKAFEKFSEDTTKLIHSQKDNSNYTLLNVFKDLDFKF